MRAACCSAPGAAAWHGNGLLLLPEAMDCHQCDAAGANGAFLGPAVRVRG